jgi:hypothetical protein
MNFENCRDEHPAVKEDDWTQESTLFLQINDQGGWVRYTDNFSPILKTIIKYAKILSSKK